VVLSVVLALVAAAANAVASVLQRKAARREPDSESFEVRLLWELVHQPTWLAGITAIIAGFLLQAGALATGPIALVQPILILELPFTLILSGHTFGNRLRSRDWIAVAGMTTGIGLLLLALAPTGGSAHDTPALAWALGCVVTVVVVLALVILGRRTQDAARAAYLGAATGVSFGLTAALLAGVTAAFSAGGAAAGFTAWQTYALIAAGPAAFFLLTNALQGGGLVASQPALTLCNPLTSIAWGIVVFHERTNGGPWVIADVVGAGLVVAGTLLLVRSPSLHGVDS
jgi:drug/metabolite transporter (DMT)-like permease